MTEAIRLLGYHVDVFGTFPPLPKVASGLPSEQEICEIFYTLEKFDLERYDVIYNRSGFYSLVSMNLQLRRTSRHRFVHTLHTVSLDYLFDCRTWRDWRFYWRALIEGMCSRYADHVIAVSDSARRLEKRYFNLAQNKCSVIWNGITPISGIELNKDDHL